MLPTLSREFAWCQEPIAIHVQLRDYLASEGLQMWCEMIVPWMGHTKTYFPFAASEFRAADDPLSQQITNPPNTTRRKCNNLVLYA